MALGRRLFLGGGREQRREGQRGPDCGPGPVLKLGGLLDLDSALLSFVEMGRRLKSRLAADLQSADLGLFDSWSRVAVGEQAIFQKNNANTVLRFSRLSLPAQLSEIFFPPLVC